MVRAFATASLTSLDPAEHCITVDRNFGTLFTDIRYLRNHIAHRNDGSRSNFRKLVRRYYGANVPDLNKCYCYRPA